MPVVLDYLPEICQYFVSIRLHLLSLLEVGIQPTEYTVPETETMIFLEF